MPTSPVLIAAAASALGIAKPSIEHSLRGLREAGLIRVSGRGPYASQMTFQDASRLLIGVCGAAPLERNAASNAVEVFETLRLANETIDGTDEVATGQGPLSKLAEEHSFGQAFQSLLEVAGDDCLFSSMGGRSEKTDSELKRMIAILGYVRVEFFRPVPVTRIIYQLVAIGRQVLTYGKNIGDDTSRYSGIVRDQMNCGRIEITTITEEVLWEVGKSITGTSHN